MYSLPISTTLAAFTMASAASIEPISPLVSTIPSASRVIDAENYHIAVPPTTAVRFAGSNETHRCPSCVGFAVRDSRLFEREARRTTCRDPKRDPEQAE